MAIDEKKRENLLVDATAYSRRMLVSVSGLTFREQRLEQLFVGVRADGRWSLYFDESPVIQLDSEGRLRRLFVLPDKFAADQGRLVQLQRPGQGGRVELARQQLDQNQEVQLFQQLNDLIVRTLHHLTSSSEASTKLLLGQLPADDLPWFEDLVAMLNRLANGLEIAPGV